VLDVHAVYGPELADLATCLTSIGEVVASMGAGPEPAVRGRRRRGAGS
jgi:hypothetical protein